MKPLVKYPGGSSFLVSRLVRYLPAHRVYVEPFCGVATMFFSKPLAEVNVLNDINYRVIYMLDAVRRGEIEKCFPNGIPITREYFEYYKANRDKSPCIEFALRASSFDGNGQDYAGDVFASRAGGILYRDMASYIRPYAEKLRKARLSIGDYRVCIQKYDSEDTLFFLDPPWDSHIVNDYVQRHYEYGDVKLDDVVDVCSRIVGKVMVVYAGDIEFAKKFENIGFFVYKHYVAKSKSPRGEPRKTFRVVATNWEVTYGPN